MTVKLQTTNAWREMQLEILQMAKSKKTFEDFTKFCRLQSDKIHKNFTYRKIVLEELIVDGIVQIEDKRLKLKFPPKESNFFNRLRKGNSNYWKLSYDIYSESDFEKLFDDNELKKIGQTGEDFIINKIKNKLPKIKHNEIKHVSKTNDLAGFDIISPSLVNSDNKVLMEVKTTPIPGVDFRFFLSANEYRASQKYSGWYLILVRLIDGAPELAGHISRETLSEQMPQSVNPRIEWQTSKIVADPKWIIPGLP